MPRHFRMQIENTREAQLDPDEDYVAHLDL
jgi:hypothetical protein